MMRAFENFRETETVTVAIEIDETYVSLSAGKFEGYQEYDDTVTLFYGGNELTVMKSWDYTTDAGDVSEECHIFSDGNMNIYIESF